jgi:hypothetical protein
MVEKTSNPAVAKTLFEIPKRVVIAKCGALPRRLQIRTLVFALGLPGQIRTGPGRARSHGPRGARRREYRAIFNDERGSGRGP